MLNRRLFILFFAFLLGFCVLALRLAKLQLVDSAYWQDEMRRFVHRHHVIETHRAAILDRNGLILAHDVPADELAIDYRAMNYDDDWLWQSARDRLIATGEWARLKDDPAARTRRRTEVKIQLADQIATIPHAIAVVIAREDHLAPAMVEEDVLQRFQEIRARIHALRQDYWSRQFDLEAAKRSPTSEGDAPEIDEAALDSRVRRTRLKDEVIAHTIRPNISTAVANYFRQHADELPGLIVRDNANRREYPFGEATAHLVGTMGSLDPAKLAENRFDLPNLLAANDPGNLAGYLPGDRIGETGAERILEPILKGTRGVRLIDLTDTDDTPNTLPPPAAADAATLPDADPATRRIDPVPGKDVRMTIDASLQYDLYHSLGDPAKTLLKGEDGKNHFAALVILSIDGQLLSAVTYPSYDPNTLADNRARLNADAYRTPLVNRAISGSYQPGSTVKPLMASAALTEHLITPDLEINCLGHFYASRSDIFKCDKISGHGPISLVDALAESCNVYFYTVGDKLGLDRLSTWYTAYGFGRDTGMELPEAKGHAPAPSTPASRDSDADKKTAMLLGIGQGPVDATPLQMANAYATLLRGGVAIPPRILLDTPPQRTQAFQLAPGALASVRLGMEHCVTVGTGHATFRGMKLAVAGKTGTAEKDRGVFDDDGNPVEDPAKPLLNANGTLKLHADGTAAFKQVVDRHDDAWFVGYAPANNPQFIVAAVMEWGGHGGAHAAPMVKEAFMQLQRHNYLPHTDVP